jgi:hypothetical protein
MANDATSPAGPPHRSPGPCVSGLQLSAIELGLLANFNLEMAEAYDQVAQDPKHRPESRQTARESAADHRERAHRFQSEAQEWSAYPTLPTNPPQQEPTPPYAGPERREHERRGSERRASRSDALSPDDRRANRDRRQGDRRRHATR